MSHPLPKGSPEGNGNTDHRNEPIAAEVSAVWRAISESDDYDRTISANYHIRLFRNVSVNGEPTEVWVYREAEKPNPGPILIEHLRKRGESLLAAADRLFEDVSEWKARQETIKKVFFKPRMRRCINVEGRKKQLEKARQLINDLINDIGYFWVQQQSEPVSPDSYKEFLAQLFENVELATPSYKEKNILVFYQSPESIEFQYYIRGVPRDLMPSVGEALQDYQIPPQAEAAKKYFFSAHYRKKIGLCNIAACFSGTVGDSTVRKDPYRHASLPPIDLYKQCKLTQTEWHNKRKRMKKKIKRGQSLSRKEEELLKSLEFSYLRSHHTIALITAHNMEMLHKFMRKNRGESADELTWVNVGLLTVVDKKRFPQLNTNFQTEQYDHTILAADRLRFRKQASDANRFTPIMFNFGVNPLARQQSFLLPLPKKQRFENHRAFLKFNQLAIQRLPSNALIDTFIEAFKKECNLEAIETQSHEVKINKREKKIISLQEAAQEYDKACNDYEKNPKLDQAARMMYWENTLLKVKMTCWKHMDQRIKAYKAQFKQLQKELKRQPDPSLKNNALFQQWLSFNDLYLRRHWHRSNFSIQIAIAKLARSIGVEVSVNCKSGNDRTGRFFRRFGKRVASLITSIHTRFDTDGGATKFLDWAKSRFEKKIAAIEESLARWFSTHKLAKSVTKSARLPQQYRLLPAPASLLFLKRPNRSRHCDEYLFSSPGFFR